MATEPAFPFSALSVVEDVLQKHGGRLSDLNLASRKAEEASSRRNEAAEWLRKTVGALGGKDLPAEPSEEDLRIALRSGIVLCTALNKIQAGAVPKVVEAPSDADIVPDGAALSVYQYFENVRNFLVAVAEMGLPSFEASDLEQGGKSSRIVNCILALKSYSEGKWAGKNVIWRFGGANPRRSPTFGKPIVRKNSEPFMRSLSRAMSDKDDYLNDQSSNSEIRLDRSEGGSIPSLNSLVREYLYDKKLEEIPILVEALLGKVMEEFEQRMQTLQETIKTTQEEKLTSEADNSTLKAASDDDEEIKTTQEEKPTSEADNSTLKVASDDDEEMEENEDVEVKQEASDEVMYIGDKERLEEERSMQLLEKQQRLEEERSMQLLKQQQRLEEERSMQLLKQQQLFQQQKESIQELKIMVHQTKTRMQSLQMKHQQEIIYLSKHLHTLASAATGYQRVREENRKLYNQVQDLKGNIRVYCRVRPFNGHPNHPGIVSNIEEGSISLATPSKNGKEAKKTFTFNRAFGPSSSQAEVFADTQPLIRSVLDGYNVCIFAYGQTGSGKTHTMSGPNNLTEETVGVNFRALRDLFLLSEQGKDTIHYDIRVQMLEIYNEQVRDLLMTDGVVKRLEIRNSSHNGINVPDANLVPVSSTADVLNLMNLGHRNRAVSSTAMNDRSSRSHSCLTVHVHGRDLTSGNSIRGCMHLVDLAGSERVDKSEVTGDRLKEAQHINKSLAALGDVIASLATKQSHVPYRNSKLTQLLQDSLGGQAKTLMFVHISPEPDALSETLSTLKFAERVSTIELGAARVNKDSADTKDLKEQIACLKAALAKKDGEAEHSQQIAYNSNHEIPRLNSQSSSPIPSSSACVGRKLPRDDSTSSIEDQKEESSKLKRRSLDLQDTYGNSPLWPNTAGENGKESSIVGDCGAYNDKSISIERNESFTFDDSLMRQGEAAAEIKHISSPILLSPRYLSAIRVETATNDADEIELGTPTSECWESEMNWQSPKAATAAATMGGGISNGSVSKAKKSAQRRQTKNLETRSMIPSVSPSSSRKQSNLSSQPRKHKGSIDAKRKTGNAK